MPTTRALRFLVILAIAGCPTDDLEQSDAHADTRSFIGSEGNGEAPQSTAYSEADDGVATNAFISEGEAGGDETWMPPPMCSLGPCDPDGGNISIECDVWAQDCPRQEKCMPWANDGGYSWNATRCSEIDRQPREPGESCHAEGSGVSGLDDCDLAAMCWNVDPRTREGVCVAFCKGSAGDPVCEDPSTTCTIHNEGVLILCLPNCDPLAQDCPEGQGCYADGEGFHCLFDRSGGEGTYGSECGNPRGCDPGLFCALPSTVPGCAPDAVGCCTEFCDLASSRPQCSGAVQGQLCVPWFDEHGAPPGFEQLGACTLPSMGG